MQPSEPRPARDAEPAEPARLEPDAVTPRGGFMARPGWKPPPRHAVVVRGGDSPATDEIPLARHSSAPPPPLPAPPAASAQTAGVSPPQSSSEGSGAHEPGETEPPPLPVSSESLPPPSDFPMVASIPAPPAAGAVRARASRWTVLVAAAAGVALGVTSVAISRLEEPPLQGSASPAGLAPQPTRAGPTTSTAAPSLASRPPAPPSASGRQGEPAPAAQPPQVPVAVPRRTIF